MTLSNLPAPVDRFIAAINAFDLDAMMATFADGALVNDHRDEFATTGAIRSWAQREIIADRVTLEVTQHSGRGGAVAVRAIVRSDFDKAGLPDPLVLTFYFSVSGGKIDQLVIVFNKPAAG